MADDNNNVIIWYYIQLAQSIMINNLISRRSIKNATRLFFTSYHIPRYRECAAITRPMSSTMLYTYIILVIYIYKTENRGVRFTYINIVKRVLSGKFWTRASPRGLSSWTCNFFSCYYFCIFFFFFFDVLPSSVS